MSYDKIINGAILRDKDLRKQIKKFNEIVAIQGTAFHFDDYVELLKKNDANMYALGFLKKYYGDDYEEGYVNYNENEWRYIIEDGFNDIHWHRSEKEYLQWRGQNNYIDEFGNLIEVEEKPEPTDEMKAVGLAFKPSDINHIIVENSEIPFIISKIESLTKIGNHPLDVNQKAILISKINSFESIKTDY